LLYCYLFILVFAKNGKPNQSNVPPTQIIVAAEELTHCKMCDKKYKDKEYETHLVSCERRTREAQIKNKTAQQNVMNSSSYANSKPNLNFKFKK
jgi:hypothetical protein